MPFTEQDLAGAFARLNTMKSTAPGSCPNVCLKASPIEVAKQLHPLFVRCIPQQWKGGSLFLLPKPGKRPDKAINLRPLALQDPVGTTTLGLIAGHARQSALTKLCAQPQYAYLPQRGTYEAISRAVAHCKLVREALLRFRRPHDYRESQNSRSELVGGFTISIDLKRAFDSLPTPQLFADLRALGVEASCIQPLQGWHVGTRYWIEHKGHQKFVDVQLGVRQGRRAAPFLWASSMSRLLSKLAQLTSPEWMIRALTLYADDFLLQCEVCCEQDLWDHLHVVGILFDFWNKPVLL